MAVQADSYNVYQYNMLIGAKTFVGVSTTKSYEATGLIGGTEYNYVVTCVFQQ